MAKETRQIRNVGRYVVRMVLRILLPNWSCTSTALMPGGMVTFLMVYSSTKYCVRSMGPRYLSPPGTSSINFPEFPFMVNFAEHL